MTRRDRRGADDSAVLLVRVTEVIQSAPISCHTAVGAVLRYRRSFGRYRDGTAFPLWRRESDLLAHNPRNGINKKGLVGFNPRLRTMRPALDRNACPAGGLHCAVPPHERPAGALRRALAARDQARRLPGHRPQDRQAREDLQPAGQ
jgi:hypothetical protein